MARIRMVLFLAVGVLLSGTAHAQCRGGGGGQGTGGVSSLAGIGQGGSLFQGPSNQALQMMQAQLAMQQMARQQAFLAQQQQRAQARQQKLETRKANAEQTRAATAAARAKTRAALAAQNGLTASMAPVDKPSASQVARR